MFTINIDWLSCTVTLNNKFQNIGKDEFTDFKNGIDKPNQNFILGLNNCQSIPEELPNFEKDDKYHLDPVRGNAQFRSCFDVSDHNHRKLLKFYFNSPLPGMEKIGQIFLYNDLHYIRYDKNYSELISDFCDWIGADFKNWCRVDICRDNDDKETFAGKYNARKFMELFMSGKLKRLEKYNACKPSAVKERSSKELKNTQNPDIVKTKLIGSVKDPYQTLYFNSNHCNISAKLYNKTIEMGHTYKDYIYQNWVGGELHPDEVFRFEVSLKNFAGHNSGLTYNGRNVAKDITIFDNYNNVCDIFNNIINASYCIKDSYKTIPLFENTDLSYNLYYVDSQKDIKDCLTLTSYTVGVKNYLYKLSYNYELSQHMESWQQNALSTTCNLLDKLLSSRFQNRRAVYPVPPVSNTGEPDLYNPLNDSIFSMKTKKTLNSLNTAEIVADQYFLCKKDRSGEISVVAGINERNRDNIYRYVLNDFTHKPIKN